MLSEFDKKTITYRIKRIRESRGLKQSVVAEALNITQQSYSQFERTCNDPHMSTLLKVSEVLMVDPCYILSFDIPITDENLALFEAKKYRNVIEELLKAKSLVEAYKTIITAADQSAKPILRSLSN